MTETELTQAQNDLLEQFTRDYVQKLVYEFATMAKEKFPQLAKDDPKEIGRIAKKAAFAFMNEALDNQGSR